MKYASQTIIDSGPDHKGLLVCDECIDIPHPKKIIRPEKLSHGAKARPYSEDDFTGCNSMSSVPGEATPGCMVPGIGV